MKLKWDAGKSQFGHMGPMSALGQERTSCEPATMSALPPIADIAERDWDVR
jgi:hypothetical protein